MRKCLVFLNFSTPFSNIFLYSHQVMSNSLWSHGLQHTRPPCPSPSPGVCSSSCPLNEWCRPTISSSVALFSCLSLSQHQSPFQWISSLHQVAKDWSFSFSISPSNEYSGLISLGSTGLICLQSKRLSRIFSSTTVQKHECMEPEANLWKISPNPVSHKKLFKGFHEFGTVQKFYIALPKTSYIVERIFPRLSITAGRKIKSINHAIRKIELSFSYMYNSVN